MPVCRPAPPRRRVRPEEASQGRSSVTVTMRTTAEAPSPPHPPRHQSAWPAWPRAAVGATAAERVRWGQGQPAGAG